MASTGGGRILGAGGGFGTGLLLLVGGLILKNAQANLLAECSSGLGRFGQAIDPNAASSCSSARELSTLATAGIWVGAALLVIAVGSFIALLIAAGVIASSARSKAAAEPTSKAPVLLPDGSATTTMARPAGRPGALSASGVKGASDASRRHPLWPQILVPVVLLAGGGAAAAGILLHSSHRSPTVASTYGTSQDSGGQPSSVSATASASSQPTQQQAAEALARLLAQSVSDRTSIVNAASDVTQCGPDLNQDPQVFQSAATSRQSLLSQLADLPGSSALPEQMLQALTSAWQASIQADQDFARWAQDEISQGCTQNDHSDPGYQAAVTPDSQATAAKKSFAGFWDPIATQYELPPYQWDQL